MNPPPPDPARRSDYGHCLEIARHAENFPVASRLLPRSFRPHLAAIYAFARGADDLADEPTPTLEGRSVAPDPGSRLAALQAWEGGLEGAPPAGTEPVFRALAATRASCALDLRPFRDLLTAFRWDVERSGYRSWDELRLYADHSAAPVGRLVLALAGVRDRALVEASDDLCVALQLTNFWQDLSVDWPRGRLYLPEELWAEPGFDRAALERLRDGGSLALDTLPASGREALGRGLEVAIQRTTELYARARDLPRRAGRPLELYLRTVWNGGSTVLARTRRLGPRAFARRPALGARGRLAAVALAWWRAQSPAPSSC